MAPCCPRPLLAVHSVPHTQVLEDIALTVQNQLDTPLPFCAFNGGNDVFVDVGNKSVGLESLMAYVGAKPQVRFHGRVACCKYGAHGTAGHLGISLRVWWARLQLCGWSPWQGYRKKERDTP